MISISQNPQGPPSPNIPKVPKVSPRSPRCPQGLWSPQCPIGPASAASGAGHGCSAVGRRGRTPCRGHRHDVPVSPPASPRAADPGPPPGTPPPPGRRDPRDTRRRPRHCDPAWGHGDVLGTLGTWGRPRPPRAVPITVVQAGDVGMSWEHPGDMGTS